MSIGKSSIARAVNATATVKAQNTGSAIGNVTSFPIDNISVLTVAKTPDDINTLKQSIEKRGILCPVLVCVTAKDDVWLLDGYRRYYAAKELGISQINAVVLSVESKRDANNIYTELSKAKTTQKTDEIHEEKFRILCVKDHDLPAYLL